MIIVKPRVRRLFLHYFDVHFLEVKGVKEEDESTKINIKAEARLATRFSILSAEQVLLPASSFFESGLCFEIIDELYDIYSHGQLYLVGSGANLSEFIDNKLTQYGKHSHQYKKYIAARRQLHRHPPFLSRRSSASRDIATGWTKFAETGNISKLIAGSTVVLPKSFESNWLKVPEKLNGKAFIVEYIQNLLFGNQCSGVLRNRLHGVVNEEYFGSFTREYCAGVVAELVWLAASHRVPSYGVDIPYRDIRSVARQMNLIKRIEKAPASELAALASSQEWMECLVLASGDYKRRMHAFNIARGLSIVSNIPDANVGIITALPEEFAAVCEVFRCDEPIDIPGHGAGRKYAIGRVETPSGAQHIVAVGFLTDMGSDSAAIRATLMIQHCPNLDHIIMVGIAGAVPNPRKAEEHVRLGDIVVSDRNGIVQYDFDKETPREIEHRHPPRPPGAALLEAVNLLTAQEMRGRRPWDDHILEAIRRLGADWQRPPETADILRDRPNRITTHPRDKARKRGKPRIFHGPIASANKLLKNPKKRNALRDKFKVKAVEMEGSGIADASWNLETGYLVIRGTCDYCNEDKNDVWHKYAAIIAASYARSLVEVLAPTN